MVPTHKSRTDRAFRKLGDHNYLTWNNDNQPSTATATGISRPGNDAA